MGYKVYDIQYGRLITVEFVPDVPTKWGTGDDDQKYLVSVKAEPSDQGGVRQIGGGRFVAELSTFVKEGFNIGVEQQAKEGFYFNGWYVGNMKVSTEDKFYMKITQNRVITAKFSQWYLSVNPDMLNFLATESVNNIIIRTNGEWQLM